MIDAADISQHSRPKGDRIERLAVAPHRGLGLGAADEVAPRPGREVAPRRRDDLVQGEKLLRMRSVHGPRGYHFTVRLWSADANPPFPSWRFPDIGVPGPDVSTAGKADPCAVRLPCRRRNH